MSYLLAAGIALILLAFLTFGGFAEFDSPPVIMFALLAIGAVVMAFRGRNPDDR
ncbi:hypothetical protein [Teichococcus vastitatis]|jgi:hypothetical protein|uniref:PEP-CTERM protein-sorting domain-containing protein n=1 Tax=Teichococcus vastitatis TaxID=2307076 RepID=A0ABS9W3W4_9PROT|nr:hypothetical protein [Pseudoroseomonas vastitatis]MCI0753896.1 hypothetical protein [Pseudoroseomonas vastitatis]